MPRVYHRFKPLREETPISFTEQEIQREKRDREACVMHLCDLLREYGGGDVGTAKALYRQRNELDILPGSEFRPVIPRRDEYSYCGSPAATTAGY